jgi:iron complex outermembrane receptor protein
MKRYNAVYSEYCSAGAGASNLNLYINGCDTDGRSFGDMPLPNLSRNSFNLALLFDKGPVSARLAYSWREKYLQGVALNSDNTGPNQQNGLDTNPDSATYGQHTLPLGLPLWVDDYGQLDAGIHYRFDDNLTVSLEGRNLTDSMYKQLMQQHIGTFGHNYFTSGRSYTVSLRYTF